MSCLPSRLYAIVDAAQTGGRPLASVIDAMLAGGVSVLQLRVKDRPADEFLRLALTARERTTRAGCLFIVNDRVDIALAAQADGVHLGQDDLPLEAARPLVGKRLIGISTHSLEQAEAAERGGADYIGFGPMFPTRTKEPAMSPGASRCSSPCGAGYASPSSASAASPRQTSRGRGTAEPTPPP